MEQDLSMSQSSGEGTLNRLGLGFNGPVGGYYAVIDHGSYVEYKKLGIENVSRETLLSRIGSNKRGTVQGMSWESRKTLLRVCFSLDWSGAVLLTLTARESPTYANVRALYKRLTRVNPRLSAVWVMELQKRGVPHYHLAIFGGKSYILPQEAIQRAWEDVLGVELAIVDIRRCDHGGGLYIAKYVSKSGGEAGSSLDNAGISGRRWGILGKKNLPLRADYDENGRTLTVVSAEERWKKPGVAGLVLTFPNSCDKLGTSEFNREHLCETVQEGQ